MRKLIIFLLSIFIFTSGLNARKVFDKNKLQIWADGGGFFSASDVGWHGNTFGIVDKAGDNKIGSGPGGGLKASISGRFLFLGVQLSETWGTLSDLTEYDGAKTQKGDGYLNSFDTKVGLMFTGKPGDQSVLFVFAGFNHRTGSFEQTNDFISKTGQKNLKRGERAFSAFSPIIGIQDVTLFKIDNVLSIGHVIGFSVGWSFPSEITVPGKKINLTSALTMNIQFEFGFRMAIERFYLQPTFKMDLHGGETKKKNDTYIIAQGISGFFITAGYYF
jgi:hypothetical protein